MTKSDRKAENNKPRIYYGFIVVAAIFCLLGIAYGVRMSYGVFFTPMANDQGWSSAVTSLAYSVSMLIEGGSNILMGYFCDKYGPRKVIIISVIIICTGYCLIPLTNEAWQFILLFGLVVGFGMGGMFVPLMSVITRWFAKRTTMMIGISMSGIGIGILILAPLCNYLVETYTWKTTFLILGIVILIAGISMSFFIKRDPASMGLLRYGVNAENETTKVTTPYGLSIREAVKKPQLWLTFWFFLLSGYMLLSVAIHLVPDIIHTGITSSTAAWIFSLVGVCQIIGRIGLGMAADKIGNRTVQIIGFLFYAVFIYWLISISLIWSFVLLAVIFGILQGGMITAQSPLIANLFGLKNHGILFGICGFGFTIGAALGPFMTGLIFDYTGSYELAFIVCTIIAVIGLLSVIILRPLKDPKLPTVRL